jgi:hypothetical protein
MAYHFKSGDSIRVSRISGSSWQDRVGIVVDVIVRYDSEPVQECAVSFDGERCWFMARHLIRTISPKLIRFFRNEALDRWQLDPDKVAFLNGDSDQLIELLCDQCDFTIRRAQTEVEQFYDAFDRKTQHAPAFEKPGGRRTATGLAESPTAA